MAIFIACKDEPATYFGEWTEDLIVSSCRVAFSPNSRTHMFQMWQSGKATTLAQRCWENVNTSQSIKVDKWVCTGFKKSASDGLVCLSWGLSKQAAWLPARLRWHWKDGPSSVWRGDPAAEPLMFSHWIVTLCINMQTAETPKGGRSIVTYYHDTFDVISIMFTGGHNYKLSILRDNITPPFVGLRPNIRSVPSLLLSDIYIFTERWKKPCKLRWTFSPAAPWDSNNIFSQSECLSLYIYIPLSPPLLPLTSTLLLAKTRRLYASVIPRKLSWVLTTFSKHFFTRLSPTFFSSH